MESETNGLAKEPKGRGRPKGLPKPPGSGRKKGTPNKTSAQTRERISREADPTGFFISLANGNRQSAAATPDAPNRTWVYPTLAARTEAMHILLQRTLPTMKATEISGPEGGPIPQTNAMELILARLAGMHERANGALKVPKSD